MLSQQEVADRAGTSLFTIQRIERGEGGVRPKTGRAVAAALGVPIEELLPKAQAPLFQEPPEEARDEQRREALVRSCIEYARLRAERWNAWLTEGDRELLGEMVMEYDSLAPFLVKDVFQAALGLGEPTGALGTEVMRALHRLNHAMERALESIERIDAESARRARASLERWSA
jgi:transcriptional regulator with XRE-family HTH domain